MTTRLIIADSPKIFRTVEFPGWWALSEGLDCRVDLPHGISSRLARDGVDVPGAVSPSDDVASSET